MKKYLILFLSYALFFFASVVPAHAAYLYYRSITVTSNSSIASSTNANFPMLVSSTVPSWASSANGGKIQNLVTAPNGGQEPADLVFATSSANCGTTNLNFETESYASSTGALVDWVNVPSLSAGSVIYACYGNSSVTTDQSNPSGVWNSNYMGVWHFPNGTTLSANDSTSNANNGTLVNAPTAASGQIDGGVAFNGTNDITTPYLQNGVTAYTISSWIKTSDSSSIQPIVNDRGSGAGQSLTLFLEGNGACGGSSCGGSAGVPSIGVDSNAIFIGLNGSTALTNGVWHQVVGTWAAPSGTAVSPSQFTLYVDGQNINAAAERLAGSASSPLTGLGGTVIGYHQAWNHYFTGSMDDVRISNVARSPSWILTSYNNQSSPSTFYTIGPETALGGTVSCNTSPSSVSFGNIDASAVYTASPNITASSTCSDPLGCTIQVNDVGSGSSPGLYKSTTPTYVIGSVNGTLVAGTANYGIQAATTTSGSGAVLTVSPSYAVTGNTVGGLTLSATTLASSTSSYTGREIVTTTKASSANMTYSGSYSDTITYSCIGN